MSKLKLDRVISFSSEDTAHLASNILSNDATKKWKCQTAGEKAANIVLQLEKASLISGIDIGNEHSAYVEVLVNRSSSTEDFKVLVVMSSFMTPLECRQSRNTNKVRMFTYADLRSPERDQKWDRIKIVCTQPFNKHVQYGLSFIILHSAISNEEGVSSSSKIGNYLLRPSSPDNLSVGNLFARRKELCDDAPLTAAAAIREASSLTAIHQGSPKCKPKLKNVQLSSKNGDSDVETKTPSKSRKRNQLLYNEDEEKPTSKIDELIDKKNEGKQSKEPEKPQKEKQTKQNGNTSINFTKQDPFKYSKSSTSGLNSYSNLDKNKRKINSKDTPQKKVKSNRVTKPFNELLSGVTIVISGIENPERSTIRNEALMIGAKYKADWDNSCTHLISAFTNTPKFSQVKGKGKIVNRMWINDCYTRRKRLPWRRYALDSREQTKNESEDEIWEEEENLQDIQDDSADTEDEIEQIPLSEKVKHEVDVYSVETDEEDLSVPNHNNNYPELPDFFNGIVIYIDRELSESIRTLLKRYITAYDGSLVEEPSNIVDIALATPETSEALKGSYPGAKILSPDWIWECHNAKKLVSDDCFRL